jgi:indolepyruvate ferredoxin oxidoreductase beta subunit
VTPVRPIRIAIAAMGGQGGGVLADWIVEMAEHADYYAQSTSVPGVAQRTGATVYYLELFPRSAAPVKPPVMALIPVPGDVDIVIAGELVEAGRAVLRGLVTPDRTTLIASNHRDYALTEKMAMGDGRTNTERLEDGIRKAARRCISFDMAALAEQTGSVISAVLFGALAGSNSLLFTRAQFEETIRRGEVGVDASLKAFGAGHDQSQQHGRGQSLSSDPSVHSNPDRGQNSSSDPLLQEFQRQTCPQFPLPVQDLLQYALPRLFDYQDLAYAREYVELLKPVAALDHGNDALLTAETARHLALWMTYEDTVRVAQAKIQPERLQRIRAEGGARSGQIVHVVEFLHPRVEEVCDTLPAGIGRWILRTAPVRRALEFFCRKGRKIRTTSLPGFLMLYAIACLRPLRRRLLRHGREMTAIYSWLESIRRAAGVDYALAVEIARCQRLVKGYGDTHARGLGNFNIIMGRLDAIRTMAQPAATLKQLRDAALADEHGVELNRILTTI